MRSKELRLVQVVGVATGSGGLLKALFLLDKKPLFGVLGVLGAMALLLESLERLCDDCKIGIASKLD